MKNLCRILLTCGTIILGSCASDQEYTQAEAAKTQETVPGEKDPSAPDAAQQQTKPGFRF